MLHLLLAAAGGAVGASGRYLVGLAAIRTMGLNYPWGTFIVNVLGSLMIGIFAEFFARKFGASAEWRVFAITGFLGGFTTFSSFSLDTISLFERGNLALAALYVISSVTLSLVAVFAGLALVRSFS